MQKFIYKNTSSTYISELPEYKLPSLKYVCKDVFDKVIAFIKRAGYIEAEVACQIREEAFDHLQELSLSYYDKNAAGWIMARLTSDSRKLAEIISWGIVDMVWGIATMLGILVMLLITFPLLALVIVILTPIIFIIS